MILTDDTLKRIKKDPLKVVFRAFSKYIFGTIRYRKGNGYDAARYWHDRFNKYRDSIRGPGDEGLSEKENVEMYDQARKIFLKFCKQEKVSFATSKVLEIGPGTGFYTKILKDAGVKNYTGLDITNVAFSKLKKEHPPFKFIKHNITKSSPPERYDLVVMIDVIEHIVEEEKLKKAMENISRSLEPKGVFILAPVMQRSKKHLFYVRHWTAKDIEALFENYKISKPVTFRNGQIISIKRG